MTPHVRRARFLSVRKPAPSLAMENIGMWRTEAKRQADWEATMRAETAWLRLMDEVWKKCGI